MPFFIPHEGCPHRCVFCDQRSIAGDVRRLPEESELLSTVASYRASGSGEAVEVAFFGGTFTALPRHMQERLLGPLQPLLASGEVGAIRVSTRPDAVDASTVDFLLAKRVTTVELGVQSMDSDVLALSARGHRSEDVARAVQLLRAGGVRVGAQLMPGLPGDTPAKALRSLEEVLALGVDFLRIYPAVVLAGTELAGRYDEGSYHPLTLQEATRVCKLMLHRALRSAIPVIRIGLQPTEGLMAQGTIVAGPFHPAFRQLVEAELCYDMLSLLAAGLPAGTTVTIGCAPSRCSDVVGQRRSNIELLQRRHRLQVRAVNGDASLSRDEVELRGDNFRKRGNIVRDLAYGTEAGSND